VTQAIHKDAAKDDDADAKHVKPPTGTREVTLPPITHQAPILVERPKTGFARQHERMTETKTKTGSTTGTWSGTKKGGEIAESPDAGGGGIFDVLVEPAEGEEKGKNVVAAGKEFFESWAGKEKESGGTEGGSGSKEGGSSEGGSAEAKGGSEGGSTEAKGGTEGGSTEAKSGSEGGSGEAHQTEGHQGGTAEAKGGESKPTESASGEAKSGEGNTKEGAESGRHEVTHTSDVQGWTMTTTTFTEHKEGKNAAIADFAADPEIRKAKEVLAFAAERREGRGHEGKTREVGAGAKGSAKTSITSRKGATRQSASAEAKGLAGVRATAQTLAVADERELTAAITALAQAGAFGDAGAKYDVKRGRAALETYAKASGGAGIQARGQAVAHVDVNPLLPTMVLFFEGAVQAGVWGQVEAGLLGSYGKVIAGAKIKASGFAGASAEAKGAVFGNAIEGFGASIQGAAKAGAEGGVTANQTIGIEGIGELEIEEGVMAFAGAQAKAKGKASISLTGVTLTAQASAFAGVKTSAWVSVAGKLRGREVVKVGGTVGVSVGAGVAVGGTFSFQHGKLTIGGDLAATLKVGGEVGGKFEIDLAALATAIMELIADEFNKSEAKINPKGADYKRETVKDAKHAEDLEKQGYKAVIDLFDDHAVKVMQKVHDKKLSGHSALDPHDLQEIIQKAAVLHGLRSTYKETDRGIVRAASDAFGVIDKAGGDQQEAVHGLLKAPIQVDALVVRSVSSISPDEATGQAKEYADAKAASKAKKNLEKDLKVYAAKKLRESATAVHEFSIQEIVDKHWKDLEASFPNGQASKVATDTVMTTLGSFLGGGDSPIQFDATGHVSKFPSLDTRIDSAGQAKKDVAQTAEEKKILEVHEQLKTRLVAYTTELIASPDKQPTGKDIQKIVDNAASSLKSELKGEHKDGVQQGIQDLVRTELKSIASGMTFNPDSVTINGIAWDIQNLAAERQGKAATATAQKRKEALNQLGAKVAKQVQGGAKSTKGSDGMAAINLKWSIIKSLKKDLKTTAETLATLDGATKDDDKIDKELEATVNGQLGGLFTVTVKNGEVDSKTWDSKADETAMAEQRRKAKATLKGGEEQDNARRRMVADAVRKPFGTYSAQVRKAVDEKAQGSTKVKITAVEKARLQEIIDKGLKSVQADVKNDVGDEALVDAAAVHFGIEGNTSSGPGAALLKKFRTQALKIDEFEAVPISQVAQAKPSVDAEKKAQVTLERALRKDVKDIPGYTPTPAILNQVIRASGVGSVANINLDSVILLAVGAVWSGNLTELDVANGVITKFELRPMEVTKRDTNL
jgi:hypothetical protein